MLEVSIRSRNDALIRRELLPPPILCTHRWLCKRTRRENSQVIRRCHPYARKSASQAIMYHIPGRVQLTPFMRLAPNTSRRFALGARSNARHCRDARVYGRTTTAMHDISTWVHSPPPASVHISCFFVHQALLSHGADRSAADTAGNTALHWAAWVGNHLVVRLLSANTTREEINCRNEEGWDTLIDATMRTHMG